MHVVEVWIAGIAAPFRLEFRHQPDSEEMRDRIGTAAATPEDPSIAPFRDDYDQTLAFPVRDLRVLRTFAVCAV